VYIVACRHLDIFKFVSICMLENVTTITLTPILFLPFANNLFEWMLHFPSMTKHIFLKIGWNTFKCQGRFSSIKCSLDDHGQPMEHVWFIGHGVFCSLVMCSMTGGCLMIGLLTLIKEKMKSFQISEEKVYIWVVE